MPSLSLETLKRIVPRGAWNVARGLQTFLPGTNRHWRRTGGTNRSLYCYEVFLKHLTLCHEAGMQGIPESVAEIGPGDSIGIGLAALIAGSDRYHALDVVPYSLASDSDRILSELVQYFRERRPNPSWGWPNYDHMLDERFFPSRILDDRALARSLAPARLGRIEAALRGAPGDPIRIAYRCPWTTSAAMEPGSIDWLWSHSVMEHVDDLEGAYASMHVWLKRGGFLSHQVDLRSHGLYDDWNGHWGVPQWQWRLIRGRRAYLINRHPVSVHSRAVRKWFDIRTELLLEDAGGIPDPAFRAPFDTLSARDRRTAGYFVVAVKR
jgi:Methyltransferase domain